MVFVPPVFHRGHYLLPVGGDGAVQLDGEVFPQDGQDQLPAGFLGKSGPGLFQVGEESVFQLLLLTLAGVQLLLDRFHFGFREGLLSFPLFLGVMALGGFQFSFQLRPFPLQIIQLLQIVGEEAAGEGVGAGVEVLFLLLILVLQGRFQRRHPGIDGSRKALGGQGPQVILGVIPPAGDGAGHLEPVQEAHPGESLGEGGEQLLPQGHQFPVLREGDQVLFTFLPPNRKSPVQLFFPGAQAGVGLDPECDLPLLLQLRDELQISVPPLHQQGSGVKAVGVEEGAFRLHLRPGHPAFQVGPDIMGFRGGGVVGVTADVEVPVILRQLLPGDHGGVAGNLCKVFKGGDDLLDVLGTQMVLSPTGMILGIGVDEQDFPLPGIGLGSGSTHDEDAGRNTGAVEEVGGEADHRFQKIIFDKALADLLLRPAPEKNSMGHHRGQHPVAAQDGQHMLDKHQVRLFPRFRAEAVAKALAEVEFALAVILAEGRIAEHPVKTHQLPAIHVKWIGDGILIANVLVGIDSVKEEIHLADGPHPAVVILAVETQIPGVVAVLLHIAMGVDQHPPGTAAGVIDPHPLFRAGQLDHQPNHFPGGVKLTALLPGGVGKLADQILIGGTEEVGIFKILIAEAVFIEMLDQIPQFLIGEAGLSHPAVEIDVTDHPLQDPVLILQSFEGLVEGIAQVAVEFIQDVIPAGLLRDEKGVPVADGPLRPLPGFLLGTAPLQILLDDFLILLIKDIGTALQKQHAEYVFLKLGSVHLAPQDIGGGKQVSFQLGQSQFGHESCSFFYE